MPRLLRSLFADAELAGGFRAPTPAGPGRPIPFSLHGFAVSLSVESPALWSTASAILSPLIGGAFPDTPMLEGSVREFSEADVLRSVSADAVAVGGSYAALDGRSASMDGGPIDRALDGANISPDRLRLWAEYAAGPLALRLQGQKFLARGFEGEDPRNDFEGYTLLDALVRYTADFGAVSLGVQNLLDEQYVSYFSDTQGPTDNLRYFAGRGRTATLTLTRSF